MRDVLPNEALVTTSARVFLAFVLAMTMCLPYAGVHSAHADEPLASTDGPDGSADGRTAASEGDQVSADLASKTESGADPVEDEPKPAAPASSPEALDPSESVDAASLPGEVAPPNPEADVTARANGQDALFTVTRTDDASEEGTLRWAIEEANNVADKSLDVQIGFDSGLEGATINLGGGLPTIQRSMTITGPQGGAVLLQNSLVQGPWRHFTIDCEIGGSADFAVTLSGLTLRGPGDSGSAQLVENGGIYADEDFSGTITLVNCTLEKNVNNVERDAEHWADPRSNGGAINVQGEFATLNMSHCVVRDNVAYWYGGGVYSLATVHAEGCTFTNNASEGVAGGGGLLAAEKGDLSRCLFEGNRSGGDSGGVLGGELEMTDCVVRDNTAGTENQEYSTGGGVGAVDLTMVRCQVEDNRAGTGGGIYCSGAVDMTDCAVADNTAYRWGGGLFSVLGGSIRGGAFTGNAASSIGGGIAAGDESAARETALSVADCTIARNKASENGGGVFLYDLCDLTMSNARLLNNQADGAGGGVAGELGASLVLTGGEVVGNAARNDGSPAGGNGGGVYLEEGDATIEGSTIADNTSEGNGGGVFALKVTIRNAKLLRNQAFGSGGGVCSFDLDVQNVRASGNRAGDKGGGVYGDRVVARGSTFDANVARDGGGVAATGAGLVNCTFSGNRAAWVGGGLNAYEAVLANCTISGNEARASEGSGSLGGGLWAETLEMNGSLVAGNYDGAGLPSEVRVGEVVDNGAGAVSDVYGKKNLIGAPKGGLRTVIATETVQGREVGALAENGGPTPTIMITPDGPAQDVVLASAYDLPALDQRGGVRPFGAAADVGAVEVSGLDWTYGILKHFGTYRGGGEPLTGTVDAPLRSAMRVEAAGKVLEPGKHYVLTEGSTVISLQPAYLKSLQDGSYEVVVTYTNGQAKMPLVVDRASKRTVLAATGDGAAPVGWATLLIASMAAVAIVFAKRRAE